MQIVGDNKVNFERKNVTKTRKKCKHTRLHPPVFNIQHEIFITVHTIRCMAMEMRFEKYEY